MTKAGRKTRPEAAGAAEADDGKIVARRPAISLLQSVRSSAI
jgi:hypothetical protein